MRVIGHSLFLILSLVIVGAAALLSFEWMQTSELWAGPSGVSVTRTTAYRVSASKWLEFGMTERGPLRVLSNCALIDSSEDATRYALDYELLDASGKIVLSGRYHHRGRMTLLRDPERANRRRPLAKTSYVSTERPSSNSAEFWIEAPLLALPGRLRIRIAEHEDRIAEVAVRAYQRTTLSPRRARSAWQRLSRRKRERLASGLAVPADWLEPFETTALASHTWRPLGPKGVDNKDYEERMLLIVNDPEFERIQERTAPPVAKNDQRPEAT